jgi:hypothetical protein
LIAIPSLGNADARIDVAKRLRSHRRALRDGSNMQRNAIMTYADTLEKAKFIELKGDGDDIERFVDPGNMFSFRSRALNLSRWTRVSITSLNLPRQPFIALTQLRFPNNTGLSVSDNFSVVVGKLTRSELEVSIWRTDANADPAIDYVLDFLIIT